LEESVQLDLNELKSDHDVIIQFWTT